MFDWFQTLVRRLGSELDGMIAKLENHEALVDSAVKDLERAVERAVREQTRARVASERLRAVLTEERDAAAAWRERAVREPFEDRGVECLRRSKRAERRAFELAEQLVHSEAIETKGATRAHVLRVELAEFREQKAALRARQTRTASSGHAETPTTAAELRALLERWEAQLRELESASSTSRRQAEIFEEEPHDAAEEAALLRELREMKEKQQ